jgi:signal transduction histidine kinase
MTNPKDQLSARLSRAKSELEEVLVEIEKLPVFEAGTVAFAAHALNNFLTVTKATTELLQLHLAKVADPDLHTLLRDLMHSTDLMSYTVSRLVNSSARGEPHESLLIMRDFDLLILVTRARDYYQRVATRKRITVDVEAAVPSAIVRSDEIALAAVLDNLLSNAVKYSPPDKRICLRVTVEPDAVVCSVQDEGPGLSPEDQTRLFQKGVRLTPTPTGGEPSTGYGLAVAKEIMTRLGGTVGCESQLGAGASFSFRLPVTGSVGRT